MPNPLFNTIMGVSGAAQKSLNNVSPAQQNAPMAPQMTMQDAMKQLQANPAQMIKQAGFNVPDEYANNPQQAVMHMIQSGQVGGPMMQRIRPMLNMLMGRR